MRRIIENLQQFAKWSEEERLLALSAALLHDIGHGPFSHTFEKVFHLDHESFTEEIILGDTEVHAVLAKVDQDFPQQVADIIAKTSENQLIVSLISSQIDADRMDYLLRDAYFTGVSYGQFDLERILRVMRYHNGQVVIKSTGMHAVEHYIMSRYQMYWQVYFHPVSRSAEVILRKILHRVKDLTAEGYRFQQPPEAFSSFFTEKVDLSEYLRLDESVVMYFFQQWQYEDDEILADLCRRFVNRKLFKYVEFNPMQVKEWYELYEAFQEAEIDPEYYLILDSSSDLPYDFYRPGEEEERIPIQLLMPNGEVRELSRESELVDAISGKKRTDHKLYFPIDRIEDLSANGKAKRRIIELLKREEK